jgi:hypothetical protein
MFGQLAGNVAALARALDESDSLVHAWIRLDRANRPPLDLLAHPGLSPSLRRILLAGLDTLYAAWRAVTPAASSAEVQTQAVMGTVGAFISMTAAALADGTISPAEARAMLPVLGRLRAQVDQLLERLTALAAGSLGGQA